jgi:hypothetical protein
LLRVAIVGPDAIDAVVGLVDDPDDARVRHGEAHDLGGYVDQGVEGARPRRDQVRDLLCGQRARIDDAGFGKLRPDVGMNGTCLDAGSVLSEIFDLRFRLIYSFER